MYHSTNVKNVENNYIIKHLLPEDSQHQKKSSCLEIPYILIIIVLKDITMNLNQLMNGLIYLMDLYYEGELKLS